MSSKHDIGALRRFVSYAQSLSGDEKGEAQVFLDRLFQGFGHAGYREAGARLEFRVSKGSNKGPAFADLVWKPTVLIEMKKRGENLAKHYRQAFDYWARLVPGRPRWVVLCNFDQFWIYDFESQMDMRRIWREDVLPHVTRTMAANDRAPQNAAIILSFFLPDRLALAAFPEFTRTNSQTFWVQDQNDASGLTTS